MATNWFNVRQLRPSQWEIRAPTAGQHRDCALVDVSIAREDGTTSFVTVPCFSCSGEDRFPDYYLKAELQLAVRIHELYFPHLLPDNALKAAKEVIASVLGEYRFDCLGPLAGNTVCVVDINMHINGADEPDVNRVVMESFEEAKPVTKPARFDSVMGLYAMRAGQERKEEPVKSWSASEHECVICMDEIEKLLESLSMPCSHVFHEVCLKRWLDDNNVCPLCRFELPYEELRR